MNELKVFGVTNLPEVSEEDDIAELIIESLEKQGRKLVDKDIVIVTSKIVSKAEGRLVSLKDINPSEFAVELSKSTNKSSVEIELILQQSTRPIKMTEHVFIMESKLGFICANSGIDRSNIDNKEDMALLLPEDPDTSAKKIKEKLEGHYRVKMAVVISDTFGRPWRVGQTNVAIGISGMLAIRDYRGKTDHIGNALEATEIAIADEIASTAELVMGKSECIPVAVVRGYDYPEGSGTSKELIRPRHIDLFR